jgi:hypothetical protein
VSLDSDASSDSGDRKIVSLLHLESGRRVPVEVPTVFGRSDEYYHYTDDDDRHDRLRDDVAVGLSVLNYIKLSSDKQVSRTHGLIDPKLPSIADLNSTNGVQLNHRRIPTRSGDAGPGVSLAHSDRLQIGKQIFEVSLLNSSSEALQVQVRNQRFGFVGSDFEGKDRAQEIKSFLVERKGFTMREAIGWPAIIANCYRLQQSAHPEGIAVCAILGEAQAADLAVRGEPMAFVKLLPLISNISGRKVIVLETEGDPSGLETVFESLAYEDTCLVTSTGKVNLEELESDLIVPTLQSLEVKRVRESVNGLPSLAGAFDDAIDGIDALVGAETNRLNVAWLKAYNGKLKVLFGKRERADDEALSHSLRLGSSTFRF